MRTSEVLDLAADQIEQHGWSTGNFGMTINGPYCALGAIGAVEYDGLLVDVGYGQSYDTSTVEKSPAGGALREYLDVRVVWLWNDKIGRTKQEVIEALRGAAAVERAKEESLEGQIIKKESALV